MTGEYIFVDNQPYLVIGTRHSYPGKHVMKAMIECRNLFTGRKLDHLFKFVDLIEMITPLYE